MREKINVEDVAKKHNVDTAIAERAINYIEEIAGLWYDNYYKANKFKKISSKITEIMQNDQEFAQHYTNNSTFNFFSTLPTRGGEENV